MTITELLDQALAEAADVKSTVEVNGVTVTPGGRFQTRDSEGRSYRISQEKAIKLVAAAQPVQAAQPTHMKFEKLNAATQSLFFQLCELIMEATQDHSLVIAAKIGRDIPKISLYDAPRISNLKKAGLIERVGEKGGYLQLTDLGRSIYHADNV